MKKLKARTPAQKKEYGEKRIPKYFDDAEITTARIALSVHDQRRAKVLQNIFERSFGRRIPLEKIHGWAVRTCYDALELRLGARLLPEMPNLDNLTIHVDAGDL